MPNFTGDIYELLRKHPYFLNRVFRTPWSDIFSGTRDFHFDRQVYAHVVECGSGQTAAAQRASDRGTRIAGTRPVATRPKISGIRWTARGNRAVRNVRRSLRRIPCHPDYASKD